MKKILPSLVLLSALTVLFVPAAALAQTVPGEMAGQCTMRYNLTGADWTARGFVCPAQNAVCTFDSLTNTCGTCCTMNAVYIATGWVFLFVVIVAGVMIVWGGFVLATSAGEAEKVKTGRNYILYGAIGVVVALLAKAIPLLARSVLQIT